MCIRDRCYAELGRDPASHPCADWRDAFFDAPLVGMVDAAESGGWVRWASYFPPAPGLPGDALWHAIFGVDLTAWSPPHLLIAAMMFVVFFATINLLAVANPPTQRGIGTQFWMVALLGLLCAMIYLTAVIEWEFPGGTSPVVAARPGWLYPTLAGTAMMIGPMLAPRIVPWRWAAPLTSVVAYLFRLSIAAWLSLTGNLLPFLPVVSLLGAVAIDLVDGARYLNPWVRRLALAVAYTAGHSILALPYAAQQPYLSLPAPDFVRAVLSMKAAAFSIARAAEPPWPRPARPTRRPLRAHRRWPPPSSPTPPRRTIRVTHDRPDPPARRAFLAPSA